VLLSEIATHQREPALATFTAAGLASRLVTDDELEATVVVGRRTG
jgi:hypothetical protein